MKADPFYFHLGDVARLLGKSPVTLRRWEREGWVGFDRDAKNDRRIGLMGVREMVREARKRGRIDADRHDLAITALYTLSVIEEKNQ